MLTALTLNDYPAFKNNTIFHCPIESGCFERTFRGISLQLESFNNEFIIGDTYKYPVTLTLVGVKGHPIGVKATSYSPKTCVEHGAFFLLEPSNWKKAPQAVKKQSKLKNCEELPMNEDYNLTEVLKSYGFKIIQNYIEFDDCPVKGVSLLGVRSAGGASCVDVLENPLSFCNFAKYLKEKTDLLDD